MHYLECNEQIQHRTGELPLAYYYVDERHPRYQMSMHWHRETELLRVRRGALRLYVDDAAATLQTGDLVVLGEGVLHGGDPENCVYECLVLDPYALLMHIEPCKGALRTVLGHTMRLESEAIAADAPFAAALERLYATARDGVEGDELRVVGALYEVFGHLTRRADAIVRTQTHRAGVKADQLKSALEYIERNYGTHISLETLARQTGLSPKYFCRCFRAIIHRSPIDYLNHYRIECASHLLTASDMTVAEIAQRCGYNDSSFFIKQFRRYKDTTPHKYRAENRGGGASFGAAVPAKR